MKTQQDVRDEILANVSLEAIHRSEPYQLLRRWIEERYDPYEDHGYSYEHHPLAALRTLGVQLSQARGLAEEMLEHEKDVRHIRAIMQRFGCPWSLDFRLSDRVEAAFKLLFARLESRQTK